MRKPGTDESNVQMSDVLCDFCQCEWTEQNPMVEGHQGSCICADCLREAYSQVVLNNTEDAPRAFACTMCLESETDRDALNRSGEPGWPSPARPEAIVCRRCIKLAAGALQKDDDFAWTRPSKAEASTPDEAAG